MATIRLRMTLPNGCEMIPPAFFIIFTSPFLMPKAAGSKAVKRVSIQERMAIFLSGYLFVMYFSYPFSATKRLLYARISSIMAFITCYCFLLTKIKKLYGSLQALHRKIVPLGNHFRRECTT